MPPLMQVTGLTKRYGDVTVVSDVGFAIDAGEILGLIGPNGSGKTTVLECLAGLLPADGGTVYWNGGVLPAERRKAALFYVPDGITPYAEHPVGAVLSFLGAVYGVPAARAAELVDGLALARVLDKRVGALSKGYRRRLLVAIGLLTPHPLVMMDEPFDGFDVRQTREVMRLLQRVSEAGRSLLLAIHQLTDAEKICDRFVLLTNGGVCGSGSRDDLCTAAGLPVSTGLEEVFLALT
jgi:ABC-2 type transport system ATP-binding protein